MSNAKKYFSVLTATTLAMVAIAPLASANYDDVLPTNPHFEAIQSMADRGILESYSDGTFRPSTNITRGQMAQAIATILELDITNRDRQFTDVQTWHPNIEAINALVEAEIVDGYRDGSFKPSMALTRSQMAVILVKAFGLEISEELTHAFRDVSRQHNNRFYIQTLVDYGITQGTSATTFSPNAFVQRAQMASFLQRIEDQVGFYTHTPAQSTTPSVSTSTSNASNLELTVSNIQNGKLYASNGQQYNIGNFTNFFSQANVSALQNAKITVNVSNKNITEILDVTVNKSSSKLNGQGVSLRNVTVNADFVELEQMNIRSNLIVTNLAQQSVSANNIHLTGSVNVLGNTYDYYTNSSAVGSGLVLHFNRSTIPNVTVDRPHTTFSGNSTIALLTATGATQNMYVHVPVEQVQLNSGYTLSLNATNQIKMVTVQQQGQVAIKMANQMLPILKVDNYYSTVALDPYLKVGQLVMPFTNNVRSVIQNYDKVRHNIQTTATTVNQYLLTNGVLPSSDSKYNSSYIPALTKTLSVGEVFYFPATVAVHMQNNVYTNVAVQWPMDRISFDTAGEYVIEGKVGSGIPRVTYTFNVVGLSNSPLRELLSSVTSRYVKTSIDGRDLQPWDQWTTSSELAVLTAAVQQAQYVLANTYATAWEIEQARSSLQNAIYVYELSIKKNAGSGYYW